MPTLEVTENTEVATENVVESTSESKPQVKSKHSSYMDSIRDSTDDGAEQKQEKVVDKQDIESKPEKEKDSLFDGISQKKEKQQEAKAEPESEDFNEEAFLKSNSPRAQQWKAKDEKHRAELTKLQEELEALRSGTSSLDELKKRLEEKDKLLATYDYKRTDAYQNKFQKKRESIVSDIKSIIGDSEDSSELLNYIQSGNIDLNKVPEVYGLSKVAENALSTKIMDMYGLNKEEQQTLESIQGDKSQLDVLKIQDEHERNEQIKQNMSKFLQAGTAKAIKQSRESLPDYSTDDEKEFAGIFNHEAPQEQMIKAASGFFYLKRKYNELYSAAEESSQKYENISKELEEAKKELEDYRSANGGVSARNSTSSTSNSSSAHSEFMKKIRES